MLRSNKDKKKSYGAVDVAPTKVNWEEYEEIPDAVEKPDPRKEAALVAAEEKREEAKMRKPLISQMPTGYSIHADASNKNQGHSQANGNQQKKLVVSHSELPSQTGKKVGRK